jgi:hypothetical protein
LLIFLCLNNCVSQFCIWNFISIFQKLCLNNQSLILIWGLPFKTILWFDLHQLFNDDNLYKMKIISRSSISSSIMISSISLSISFSLSYPRYVWLAIIWRSVWLNRYWSLSKDLCARCPILVFSFYVILIKDSSKN